MKEMLSFIISITVLIVLFEMFCSNNKLAGFMKFAFSALIVFISVGFVINLVAKIELSECGEYLEIQVDEEKIEEQVSYIENIIKTRIKLEKEVDSDVEIIFEIEGNGAVAYKKAKVRLYKEEDNIIEEVQKIVGEYLDCQVDVYV